MKRKTLKIKNEKDISDYKKNMSINFMDSVPTVNDILDRERFHKWIEDSINNARAGLNREPTPEEKLKTEAEYSTLGDHNFECVPIHLCIHELNTPYNGRPVTYFINSYYETPYGRLYSITDENDDTFGRYEKELSKELIILIDDYLKHGDD